MPQIASGGPQVSVQKRVPFLREGRAETDVGCIGLRVQEEVPADLRKPVLIGSYAVTVVVVQTICCPEEVERADRIL